MGSQSTSEGLEFTTQIRPAKRLIIHKLQQSYLYQIRRLPVKENPLILQR
jgi:hypothetical protein